MQVRHFTRRIPTAASHTSTQGIEASVETTVPMERRHYQSYHIRCFW